MLDTSDRMRNKGDLNEIRKHNMRDLGKKIRFIYPVQQKIFSKLYTNLEIRYKIINCGIKMV